MKTDFSKLAARVIDNGLSVSFAERLARKPDGFGRVEYFCPYASGFPTPNLAKIGTGFGGVERIYKFWDDVESVDLFIFLDVGFGDLQEYLRRIGKKVWGSGAGQELEMYRWHAREMHAKLGLPVVPAELITGLSNLNDYLKTHENVWIKISEFRGIGETWNSVNYDLSKPRLDSLQQDLGPLAEEQSFIVEQTIDTAGEVGYDGYNIDGQFPSTALAGVEGKDVGFIMASMKYSELPDSIIEVNSKLTPAFKQYGYRGHYSSEIREGKGGIPYLTDSTCRVPMPPSELQQEIVTNWPEIMWAGARGELVDMQVAHKYGFEFILYSDFAPENFMAVEYPKEIANYVKLYNSLRRNGVDYVVPTDGKLEQVGAVVGFGDNIAEAIKQAEKNADMVKGDRLGVKTGLVPKLMDTLRECKKRGINFGSSPISD